MKKNRAKNFHLKNVSKSRSEVIRIGSDFVVFTEDGSVGSASSIRKAKLEAKDMGVYNRNIMRYIANDRKEMMCAISINKKNQSLLESKYKDIEI